jgi:hypothetical protein
LNATAQNTLDTWLNSFYITEPDSKSNFIQVGQYNYGARKFRGLLSWTLPKGTGNIKKIEIFYYCVTSLDQYQANNGTLGVYSFNRDANYSFTSKANWNTYNGKNSWATPGTNYTVRPIDTTTIGYASCTSSPRWINFTIMGTGAENPLNLTWGNSFQILLKQTDETLISRSDRLQTQEASMNKPRMRITYSGI